jgi:hypothetical protein
MTTMFGAHLLRDEPANVKLARRCLAAFLEELSVSIRRAFSAVSGLKKAGAGRIAAWARAATVLTFGSPLASLFATHSDAVSMV